MATTPLTNQQLADIRGYHERTTHPDWHDKTHVGMLLTEHDRLAAELDHTRTELNTAQAAIDRTTARMQGYSEAGAGSVNPRQVINLLSPTWPDGNFEASAAAAPPAEPPSIEILTIRAQHIQDGTVYTLTTAAGITNACTLADIRDTLTTAWETIT